MADKNKQHLEELSNKHYYDIADEDPDVKDWIIADDSGKKIGVVHDLLFDPDEQKARYLITNLKEGMFEEDRRVLIPVGRARLNKEDRRVLLTKVSSSQISRLPTYTKPENVTGEDERAIRDTFAEIESTEAYDRNTFYQHEDFDETKFRGKA